MSTTDSLSLVGREVQRHDPDRFLTVLMAPADRREDLFALYAFNSEVARIAEVTREALLARMRVQWWRDVIAAIFEHGTVAQGHPVTEALAVAILRHDLPRTPFDDLLDARDRDAEPQPIDDMETLDLYLEGTGGDLARLAARILGARSDEALYAVDHVGRSYALIGLLRATPFLARQNRLYLPHSLLSDVGAAPDAILRGQPDAGLKEAVRHLATGAAHSLSQARAHRDAVSRSTIAAYLPALIAEGYLKRLRAVGHDVFHPRMALPKRRPLGLLLAALRGRF